MYEIEMAVIGSLMLWREDLYDKLIHIEEDDFSMPELQHILRQMKQLPVEADMTIILTGLTEEEKVVLLKAADTYAQHQSSFNGYLIRLKEYSKSRRIKNALYATVIAEDTVISTADLLKIAENEGKNEFLISYAQKAKDHLKGFSDRIQQPIERINTGWGGIDRTLKGLRKSAISIIGAPPSTGKTAFALNIVSKNLMDNKKMIFFSLEMSADMIIERLFSTFNEVDYAIFNSDKKTPTQIKSLESFQKILEHLELYIFDDVYDIETQNAIISEIKPEFVVVDYIQKVTSKRKSDSRRTEVEYISGQYKQIAKYNNCHTMLLSQLARTAPGTKPTMRDLKESGALEADGDYIMILNRPFVQDKEKYTPDETHLLIDKNKFGEADTMKLTFIGRYQKFLEVSNRDE